MTVEVRDQRMLSIIDPDADIEQIGTGFGFTEGPIWHPVERTLIFSDIAKSHMHRWHAADGRIESFRTPSNMANGNAYDREGRILTCEHESSQVTRTGPDGEIEVIASHWDGKQLNSPNDIVVDRNGVIYFTDPLFGRQGQNVAVIREPELDFQGVYRIGPDGMTLLVDDFEAPNGLCLSLDEQRLFVNDTFRGHIRVFDIAGDGTLSGGDVWAETTGEADGRPDGMKLDETGNLYCTGPGGVHAFSPETESLGVINVPETPANFGFGGDDLRDMFFTARTSLYRTRVKIPGVRLS
jgi:gluconolactonase